MNSPIKTLLRERKTFFVASILFSIIIGMVFKLSSARENVLNFIIFFIIMPLSFSIIYVYFEDLIKKNRKKGI